MKKTKLEEGDVIFQLRNGTAEVRLVIDRVNDEMAYSGQEYMFLRKEFENITRITKETGFSKIFAQSFILESPQNSAHYTKQIRLRYIRNFNYQLLSTEQLIEIEKNLKTLIIK